jgi:hypothetical protein
VTLEPRRSESAERWTINVCPECRQVAPSFMDGFDCMGGHSPRKMEAVEVVRADAWPWGSGRDDCEQLVTDILVALDDYTDLPTGPDVDDAREAVMRELLGYLGAWRNAA